MKKRVEKIFFTCLTALLIFAADYAYIDVFMKGTAVEPNHIIVIDAGHGGRDGGAIGRNGTVEKDVNLAIALKLKGYIEEYGDRCIMIRQVDEALYSEYGRNGTRKADDMRKRKDMITKSNADVFVSIHLNSFPQAKYFGAQVFYPKSDEKSQKLAGFMQQELLKVLDRNNKRSEKATDLYYIINENPMPSVLVECGFLSNPEEEQLLNDENYQNKIAFAIYCGILRYYSEP